MANQIHRKLEEWPIISNFLFRTLQACHYSMLAI